MCPQKRGTLYNSVPYVYFWILFSEYEIRLTGSIISQHTFYFNSCILLMHNRTFFKCKQIFLLFWPFVIGYYLQVLTLIIYLLLNVSHCWLPIIGVYFLVLLFTHVNMKKIVKSHYFSLVLLFQWFKFFRIQINCI